jgi:putative ABC transport system substrate-binding protein
MPVDVLLTSGNLSAEAAFAATRTIPIVIVYPDDPVGAGLVASLGHPGGNVTGLTQLSTQLHPKRLELLKQTVPTISRVAVARNPEVAFAPMEPDGVLQIAAQTLGVELLRLDVRVPEDLDPALIAAKRAGADAVLWSGGGGYRSPGFRSRFVALAMQYQLPAICGYLEWAPAGILMAYGQDFPGNFRSAATYIDKILKGAKPADLPVEQAREFELVVNLQTARTLGLTIPPQVLAQTTEVIP